MAKKILFTLTMLMCYSALPAGTMAEENKQSEGTLTGYYTLGGGGVALDDDSFKFGEYTGLTESQGFFIGDADISYNRNSYFSNFIVENVGLDNRNLFLELGNYESYKVFFQFDQNPHFISNHSRTPFDGGGTSLTLPAGFTGGATTSDFSLGNLNDKELETQRRAGTFGFTKNFGQTDVELSYTRENKEGNQSLGATFGSNGGNPLAVVLPAPVDQTTDDMTFTIDHHGEKFQLQFEYYFSLYDNEDEVLLFDNPYAGTTIPNTSAIAPAQGLISRPPDNQYHKVGLSGGVDLPHSTRVSAVAEYGMMRQNEDLLPLALGSSPSLLPRSTADAEIDTLHFMLNVASNPLPKTNLRARYRHYETDNKTPKTLFLITEADSLKFSSTESDASALHSLPYEYSQDRVEVGGTYQLFKRTYFNLGYDFEYLDRDFREVEQTSEHTVEGKVRSNFFSFASANAGIEYSDRNEEDNYDGSRVFKSRHSEEHFDEEIASGVAEEDIFDENPLLRRFDISDRQRLKAKANITFFPTDNITLGVYYNLLDDDYGDSTLGLTSREDHNATIDLTFTPTETASLFAFYTYENIDTDQSSRAFTSASNSTDSTRNWSANHDDVIHTVGAGASVDVIKNKANVSVDYSFSQATTDISFMTGTNSSVADPESLPEVFSRLHSFSAIGKYRLTKNLVVGIKYLFELFDNDDFLTDEVDAGSDVIDNVLLLTDSTPDYEGHLAAIFATYYFDADSAKLK